LCLALTAITACGHAQSVPAGSGCDIEVKNVGSRALEEDYLPHVLACENRGAGLEALKALAVAARSVAFYEMARTGSICDSQGCQVYTCNNQPDALVHQAVEATRGEHLSYGETKFTYGFYVAGDSSISSATQCKSDETYVTYNEGRSRAEVEQSSLGFVDANGVNPANRGCMSQWGSRCLESEGYEKDQILRFYYGDDIVIAHDDCF
jgi:peptidoglycan hydrolase-like amidase